MTSAAGSPGRSHAIESLHQPSELLPSKLFFRIGEVAGLVGVEPHVLRYWEREFRAIRPTKSSKGQRVYSRKDVENLLRVRALLYEEGFTIAGAKKKLARPTDPPQSVECDVSVESASPSSSPVSAVMLAERPAVDPAPATQLGELAGVSLVARGEPRTVDLRAPLLDLRAELERLLSSLDEE